jgi:hypothetical protein
MINMSNRRIFYTGGGGRPELGCWIEFGDLNYK